MINFDLNISITLKEAPFLSRFEHAARLGFTAVEFWWPADEDRAALVRQVRDLGLQVALFNFDGGDLAAGDRGLLNDPAREAQFHANLPIALELAHQLGCTRLNALVGRALPNIPRDEQLARVRNNLQRACALAAEAGITVLVEAVNTWENPGYLLNNTTDTLAFIESVGAANLAYQYDVYHMQRMEGNICATISAHAHQIGHIQIADSPGRNQPGTGELNFPFIFAAIEQSGYSGFVGLEYNPLGPFAESLAWLPLP
jgi:hydroxypyruvate isomerase